MNRKIHFILNYIISKKKSFLMVLVCSAIFAFTFWMYGVTVAAVLYPALVCMVIMAAAFAIMACSEYGKWKNMQEILQRAVGDDSEFVKILDTAEIRKQVNTTDEIENELLEIIERLKNGGMRLNDSMNMKYSDMVDYYTMWVHQIKTPIAALRLLLAEEEDERSQEMWEELFSIEQYVEMALQFSRLSAKSTDFVIGEVSLDKVVREAIHKYARLFVRKKIKLELTSIDTQVLTDEKWLEFVIEQILSNAIKYTAGGTISVYLKEEPEQETKELVIEDTGIGIAPEDLPRIFEKGYTGYNGHADKRSTGIGLYLCRKIMRKLSHEITIESEIGVGTKVHLEMRSRDK